MWCGSRFDEGGKVLSWVRHQDDCDKMRHVSRTEAALKGFNSVFDSSGGHVERAGNFLGTIAGGKI